MWVFNACCSCLLFFIGVLTFIYLYIGSQFSFWTRKGVPFKRPSWLFGNFGDTVRGRTSITEISVELYQHFRGERFGGIWRFFSPILFVVDPELIRDIFVKDFDTWSSRDIPVNPEVDPLSDNLVALAGKKWKFVRSKLTPTFTSQKLKQMHYLLLECGKELEKYLETLSSNGDGLVEAREMSARFTTDVIGSCVFGIQMNSLGDEQSLFRKIGRKIFVNFGKQNIVTLIQSAFPPVFKLLKLSLHDQELTDFFIKITKDCFEYRDKNNVQRNDFIDLLRGLRNTGEELNEDEFEFDDELLAAQAYVFFGAGFETSSSVISFCLHELAVNQEIQNRLREEIHKTKGEMEDEQFTWDGLKDMKYLDMIFQETLRKYPPFPLISRKSVKPYKIPGTDVELPSGSSCIIPVYAIHRDSNYYPDPEKFDPERFTDEAKRRRPPVRFIPFGGGPRHCIGLRFAEQQTKLALVKLVDRFKVSLCEKSQNPLQLDPKARFPTAKGGIWIRVSKN